MTRRGLLGAMAAAAFAAERKNRAPVSREDLKVKLPEAAAVKLSNGVTVLALEDNRLPLVFTRFQVEGAGAIYSPRPGIAEMTAELLREGAGGRTGRQIVAEASRLGATISSQALSGAEVATVNASGLSGRFAEWLELQASVLLRPTFPADEFAGLRQRRAVQSQMRLAQAPQRAGDLLLRAIYGDHPAAVAAPSAEDLAALTAEMISAWHRERYAPESTVISCIGRVKAGEVTARAEALFGAWKAPAPKFSLPPEPRPAATRRVIVGDLPGAPQTDIAIGGLLFDRRDPDFFPMSLLNNVLGGGSASRLFLDLREDKRYGFSADSNFAATRFTGFWQVNARVRAEATGDAIALIHSHLKRLCEEPVGAEELAEAQRAVVGRFALNLEQPTQVIAQSYLRYRYGFSADYWERYPAKVAAVNAGEIQAVAQKYLRPDRAHIVAVGDAVKFRAVLAKLGKVEAG